MAEIDENEPDIDGNPQTLWRGERLYLDNIDQVNKRSLTTADHGRSANMNRKLLMSRDESFANTYAVETDGVKCYDGSLKKEEIPNGAVCRINNKNNHLKPTPNRSGLVRLLVNLGNSRQIKSKPTIILLRNFILWMIFSR